MVIRAVIADDEALGRRNLASLVDTCDGWEVVAEVGDGEAVISAVAEHQPDALFLDIHMPRMSGMQAARALLENGAIPYTIFVTAFSDFAVEAFEINAVDYLLKPIRKQRFMEAVGRVETAIERREVEALQDRVATVIGRLTGDADTIDRYIRRIAVRSVGRVRFVDVADLEWIGAAGNYVELHVDSGAVLHRQTLASLLEQLDDKLFMQVHRSAIVNRNAVIELVSTDTGGVALKLRSGDEVPVSDTYRAMVKRELGL